MVSNRMFSVQLGDKQSKSRRLNDGLLHGSALSPLLFNLCIHDLPDTAPNKFICTEDITLAVQNKAFSYLEETLETDLKNLQ